MSDPLPMELFRTMERPAQVQALEESTALGVAVCAHYVAHYYMHEDFYVGLCSTRCGVDFTLAFRGGNEYRNMLRTIALRGMPGKVGLLSPAERMAADVAEERADHARHPLASIPELMAALAQAGLGHQYEVAKANGMQMEFVRMFDGPEWAFLHLQGTHLGTGSFDHYYAHYNRLDDFYTATCTTGDGVDFRLAFRSGRAYADMRRALGGKG